MLSNSFGLMELLGVWSVNRFSSRFSAWFSLIHPGYVDHPMRLFRLLSFTSPSLPSLLSGDCAELGCWSVGRSVDGWCPWPWSWQATDCTKISFSVQTLTIIARKMHVDCVTTIRRLGSAGDLTQVGERPSFSESVGRWSDVLCHAVSNHYILLSTPCGHSVVKSISHTQYVIRETRLVWYQGTTLVVVVVNLSTTNFTPE